MPRLDLGEGQSIFYTDEGDGVAVIALHGWACDGGDWNWLAADMVADHRVVVPDLRGGPRPVRRGRACLARPVAGQRIHCIH